MRYRISAAALILQEERILLVHHRQAGQYDFWVPPGGSLEGSESIFDCARRKTREETGLEVQLESILYIQELWEPGYLDKFFILAGSFQGELTLANTSQAEDFPVEARFFRRDELPNLNIYPTIPKGRFWQDLKADPPATKYLGLERMQY